MRRVVVIGISGAGKSTFARALAGKTGLPLFHLDKEYWHPGWRETPRAERWIMEGNYAGTLDLRLPRADTVFWFDYPALKCLARVLRRLASSCGTVRVDMGRGCPERLDWEFLRYVWRFNKVERPKTLTALARFAPHLAPVVFRRDGEVTRFLEVLS
jgi:adenylate kinase family enzyme